MAMLMMIAEITRMIREKIIRLLHRLRERTGRVMER